MIKGMKREALVSLIALGTVIGAGTAVSAQSLKEALAAAYENNPQLQAQRAAVRVTDEGVRRAKSNYLPTAAGNFQHVERETRALQLNDAGDAIGVDPETGGVIVLPPEDIPGFESAPQENIGITVDQNLFRGLRTHNEIQQRKAQVFAARAGLTSTEQQVMLDAVTAYMDVYRDEATYKLNENNVAVLARQLEASQDRARVGDVTKTDVAQSEARLEGARAQLLAAEAQLAASRATFERVVGQAPTSLEKPVAVFMVPETLQDAVELAMAESPTVEQARQVEEAARKGIHVAEGALLPTVTLQAGINRNSGVFFFGPNQVQAESTNRQVVLNVNVPIYTGGSLQSDVRRAKQERSQRMMEIRQAEVQAREQVLTAFNQYRAAEAQIIAREAEVSANELALEGVREEARQGQRTTLDVLDAEQELLNSNVNLVGAERDRTVAGYTLYSAMGQLTAKKMDLDVTIYDPNVNYKKVRNKIFGF